MTRLYEIEEPEKIWVKCSACSTAYCIIENRCPNCNMPFTDLDNTEIVEIRKKQTEIEEKLQSNYEKEISSVDEEIDEKQDNSSMDYLDRQSYYEKKKEEQLKGKRPIPTPPEKAQSTLEHIATLFDNSFSKHSNVKNYATFVIGLIVSLGIILFVYDKYVYLINALKDYIVVNPAPTQFENNEKIKSITSLVMALVPLIMIVAVIRKISITSIKRKY